MISLKNINPDNWERFDVRAIEKQIQNQNHLI